MADHLEARGALLRGGTIVDATLIARFALRSAGNESWYDRGGHVCVKPWTIIPMVVTDVQDFIAAGHVRGGEQLIDPQQVTLLAHLKPLYKGGLDSITPGSSCIANAYSNNHDLIAAKGTGALKRIWLHVVDALGLVHALILRLQALVWPIKTLVFGGH